MQETNKEFGKEAARIIRKAVEFNKKARTEGILALENAIGADTETERDILEYGIRLVIDGTDSKDINSILSNLIDPEQNKDARRLKTIQKEAVLSIQRDEYPRRHIHILLSYLSDSELETVREALSDTDIFKMFLNEPVELGGLIVSVKFFEILAELLEKSLGKESDPDIITRIAKRLRVKPFDPERIEEITVPKDFFKIITDTLNGFIDNKNIVNDIANQLVLRLLKDKNPELAANIQENPFVFNDIINFDDISIQKVLYRVLETDPCELAKALNGADTGVQNRVFRNLSKRTAAAIKEDMECTIKLTDIIEAQQKIFAIIRQLEAFGEIGSQKALYGNYYVVNSANIKKQSEITPSAYVCESAMPELGKRREFLKQASSIIHRSCEFSEKSRREGILVLDDFINKEKAKQRDIFEYGMLLGIDGADFEFISKILSNLIEHEQDEDARRLKTIQKEAVRSIRRGDNSLVLLHFLTSHLDNSELAVVIRNLSDTEIFKDTRSWGYGLLLGEKEDDAMQQSDFTERLAFIMPRVCELSQKAREEGLLALDGLIDEHKRKRRDIFECGISFVVEGTHDEIINRILSNLITGERNERAKRLKAIQKEAVLGIQRGDHPWLFLSFVISLLDNSELAALRAALSGTDIHAVFELLAEKGRIEDNIIEVLKGAQELVKADPDIYLPGFPTALHILSHRGDAYSKEGQYDLAIKDYTEIIRLDPYYFYYNKRGVLFYKKGQYDLAIKDYSEAIRLKPSNAVCYDNRGDAYMKQGQYDLAIADYSEAIKLDPDSAAYYNDRGFAYYKKGQYDLAIKDYSEAIKLKPDSTTYYNNRGNAYYNKGQYDLAIKDYSEVIKLNPDSAICYNNRGFAYYTIGQYDLAIADYSEAIKLNPNNSSYYDNRGLVYYIKGQYDLVIADYSEAIKLDPNNSLYYYTRGDVYRESGQHDLAIGDFEKILSLDPDDEFAKSELAKLRNMR